MGRVQRPAPQPKTYSDHLEGHHSIGAAVDNSGQVRLGNPQRVVNHCVQLHAVTHGQHDLIRVLRGKRSREHLGRERVIQRFRRILKSNCRRQQGKQSGSNNLAAHSGVRPPSGTPTLLHNGWAKSRSAIHRTRRATSMCDRSHESEQVPGSGYAGRRIEWGPQCGRAVCTIHYLVGRASSSPVQVAPN